MIIRSATRTIKRFVANLFVVLICFSLVSGAPMSVLAATDENRDKEYYEYSQNSINMYCSQTGSHGDDDSNGVIMPLYNDDLVSVLESYGELAMDLQEEWGTPWEVVFAQMVEESGVGNASNSIAAAVAENGYYNWLGITGRGGRYSVGRAYVDSNGREWAQYRTVEKMIKDWAGEYIARNGSYDEAFFNLDPDNYQLDKFLDKFIMVYAPPEENDTSTYIRTILGLIEGTIKDVRVRKHWKSSAELARDRNIGIGGRHPIRRNNNNDDNNDDNNDEDSSDDGGCTLLRSSPDYDSNAYRSKISRLHDFNQRDGTFRDYRLCGEIGSTVSEGGCGVMSLYAAYYMFSGKGWNDAEVFEEFLSAAKNDGYIFSDCGQVASTGYGQNLENMTKMSGETTLIEDSYSGDHWNLIKEELKRGNKVVINVIGGDGSYFTSGGHYMLFDHYNEEKDKMFLFDPYLNEWTVERLDSDLSSNDIEYDNFRDGIYLSRSAVDRVVKPRRTLVLTYNDCYNGGSGGSGGSGNACSGPGGGGGGGGIIPGGMNFEQAKAFVRQYRQEASRRLFGHYGRGYANGDVIGVGWVNDSTGCTGGTLNNCSAFTQWFVNNYTSAGPSFTSSSGSGFVNLLLTSSDDFEDGGQTPRAYAIFSEGSGEGVSDNCNGHFNHTGVVLGIDTENGKVYTGEASCGDGFTGGNGDYTEEESIGIWPGVHVHTLESMVNSGTCGYTYAYPRELNSIGNDD